MPKKIMVKGECWELDLHSTMLSRKMSYHRCIGKVRYVKIRKVKKA
uniref:Uncharacterized protein n=1 Tax=viral metagenome TaxID=1070528 RepID=A0A6M3KLK7_9ZZZZ